MRFTNLLFLRFVDRLAIDVGEKLVVVIDIVLFFVMVGGQHKTYGPAGEVVERAPRVGIDEQALPRMVQQNGLSLAPIVERDVKRAAQRNDQLL